MRQCIYNRMRDSVKAMGVFCGLAMGMACKPGVPPPLLFYCLGAACSAGVFTEIYRNTSRIVEDCQRTC